MSVRLDYPAPPPIAPAYLRGLFDRRPRRLAEGAHVPLIEAGAAFAMADPAALERYREVCELPDDGLLPVAYPHVLAGGLHMAMLQHPAFPVRLPGLVHLANTIDVLEGIPATAPISLECRLDESALTHRGAEFTLRTEASVEGSPAWRETMTFLSPSPRRGGRSGRDEASPLPPAVGEFEVPADTGRRYARVSGDYNPIHLAAPLARPFGFRSAIAHGMWSLARCQAWLGGRASAGAHLDVRFLKPLFLPGRVRLLADATGEGTHFWLVGAESGRPSLRGLWRPGTCCDEPAAHADGARDVGAGPGVT